MPLTTLDDLKAFFDSLPEGTTIVVSKEGGQASIFIEEPPVSNATSATSPDLLLALGKIVDTHVVKVEADPVVPVEDPVVPA